VPSQSRTPLFLCDAEKGKHELQLHAAGQLPELQTAKREGAKRRAIDEIHMGSAKAIAPSTNQQKYVGNVTLPLPKRSNTRVSMTCHNIIAVAIQAFGT